MSIQNIEEIPPVAISANLLSAVTEILISEKKTKSSLTGNGLPADKLMSLDISLLHFRMAARSAAVRADSWSSRWPSLLLSMRVGEWKVIATVSVWTETSDEKTGRFNGYRERAPDSKVRWCLLHILLAFDFRHDNNHVHDSLGTPLSMKRYPTTLQFAAKAFNSTSFKVWSLLEDCQICK